MQAIAPPGRKNRPIAVALALAGACLPLAGWHKFYLGQVRWGLVYLALAWTPLPRIASALEALWYLAQEQAEFDQNFNPGQVLAEAAAGEASDRRAERTLAAAAALREIDRLRAEGLISEGEFEQQRRALLEGLG